MSRWTHATCTECFRTRHPEQVNPVHLVRPYDEKCCYCGNVTRSGLYDRNDPQLTPCLGREGTIHRDPEEAVQ